MLDGKTLDGLLKFTDPSRADIPESCGNVAF